MGLFVRKQESVGSKGYPDLFLGNPKNGRHMMLEMKTAEGRESAHQKQTIALLKKCGVHVFVAWGPEQARAAIAAYLLEPAVYLGEFKA
jgi:hypothetical protein